MILVEYAFGVIFSIALGVFVLLRGHSGWQIALSMYLLCIGMNYVPMLIWTISIRDRQNARGVLGDELLDQRFAMRKYRRASLLLLVPIFPVIRAVAGRRRKSSS